MASVSVFTKAIQDEFYAIAFRKKVYRSIDQLQQDLNLWLQYYNQQRSRSGKYGFGKTPLQTFIDSIPLAKEKLLESLAENQSFFPFSFSQQHQPLMPGGDSDENWLSSFNQIDTL